MKELSASVRRSVKAYRWLIHAYPDAFRREFGEGMVHVFTDMASDARQNRGLCGLAWMWFHVLGDLAWSVLSEHYKAENRSSKVKTAFYAFASIVLAMAVQYFVMLPIGIVVLTVHLLLQGTMAGEPTHWSLELFLFFLPPLLAAMILVRTKPFYRPWLTAPLGAMAFFALAFLSDSHAPWWAAVAVIAFGGALSLAGCWLGARIGRGPRKDTASLVGVVE